MWVDTWMLEAKSEQEGEEGIIEEAVTHSSRDRIVFFVVKVLGKIYFIPSISDRNLSFNEHETNQG